MPNLLLLLPKFFATLFYDQQSLVLENLALRQQVSILQWSAKRPQFTNTDRCFWILLSRFWSPWRTVNTLVQARYLHLLASTGISLLLALEKPMLETRSSQD